MSTQELEPAVVAAAPRAAGAGRSVLFRVIAEVVVGMRGFLILPVVGRTLGAGGYGIFTQLWLAVSFAASVVAVSLDSALVRELANRADRREAAQIICSTLTVLFGLCCIFIVLMASLSSFVGPLLLGRGTWHAEMVTVAFVTALSVNYVVSQSVLQAYGLIPSITAVHMARALSIVAVTIVAAIGGAEPWRIVLAGGLVDVIVVAGLWVWIIRNIGWERPSLTRVPEMLRFGAPLTVGNAITILMNAIPRVLLIHISGAAAVGSFSASVSLTSPIGQTSTAFQYALFPSITKLVKSDGQSRAQQRLHVGCYVYAMFAMFAAVGTVTLGNPLVRFLTKDRIILSPAVIALTAAAAIGLGIFRVANMIVLAEGRSAAIFHALVIAVAICSIVAFVAIPLQGSVGAGIAQCAGSVVLAVAAWRWSAARGDRTERFDCRIPLLRSAAIATATTGVLHRFGSADVVSSAGRFATAVLLVLVVAVMAGDIRSVRRAVQEQQHA